MDSNVKEPKVKSLVGKQNKTSPTQMQEKSKVANKKSKKISLALRERAICNWINGLPGFKVSFPQEFAVWHPPLGEPQIIQHMPKTDTVRIATHEHMATLICDANLPDEYLMTFSEAVNCAKRWKWSTPRKLEQWPKPIAFKSDKARCFSRLTFDAAPKYSIDDYPVINEILSRMADPNAFCAMIGQCYLPDAPRKQALWLHGDSNSGKSFLLNHIVAKVCGGDSGTATFSGEALKGAHWKQPLIGKSLLVINEASKDFLRGESFKSLTGDDLHMINPKGQPMFQGQLTCRVFFSSNDEPEIPNDPALVARILNCKISAFKGTKLAPHLLEKAIEIELPFFIAHCIELAKDLGGKEIVSSESAANELIEAIASHESEIQYVFNCCFKLEPSSKVTHQQFHARLDTYLDVRRGITINRMKTFLKNNYQIQSKRCRDDGVRDRYYYGIQERHLPGVPMSH